MIYLLGHCIPFIAIIYLLVSFVCMFEILLLKVIIDHTVHDKDQNTNEMNKISIAVRDKSNINIIQR